MKHSVIHLAAFAAVICAPATASAVEWGAGLNANWGGGLTVDTPSRLGTSGSVAIWCQADGLTGDASLPARLILGVDAVWPGFDAFDTTRTTLVPHLSIGSYVDASQRSRLVASLGVATKFTTQTPTIGEADRVGGRLAVGLEFPSDTFLFAGWFDARLGFGLETWFAALRTPSEGAEIATGVQLRFALETQ